MKKYVLREKTPREAHERLAEHPELIRDLLYGRGIGSGEDAAAFLSPSFENHSYDPFLLPDMEKGVERILSAIEKGEKICVWSDYDCDGIPGGAMLRDFFDLIGYSNVVSYIPHRHTEGYGLNTRGLEGLVKDGVSLVITVDSGITDVEPVAYATARGMDVIVTDHHLPFRQSQDAQQDVLPAAFAVINPKRKDNAYPFDGLCGAGVAWKLVQGILAKNRFGVGEGKEKWLLDLVGLATIADMVPLCGENRALAHWGLVVLRKSPRPGLQRLLELARANQHTLTEDDVAFTIAPRINAASRMDAPEGAFDLLRTRDEGEAETLAKHLQKMNDARKGVVAVTVKEIKERISSEGVPSGMIIMGNPKWRPGLLGLVAQNIMEEYGRTVCLWGREGGETIKGSCRSDGSVNIVDLMSKAGPFLDFGGHQFSGGFSLREEGVHGLSHTFIEAYERTHNGDAPEEIFIDRELDIEATSPRSTLSQLRRLAPFGEGNPKPLFVLPHMAISSMKMFGKTGEHLELGLSRGTAQIKAIAFYSSPESFTSVPKDGTHKDIVAHLEYDAFKGGVRLRLVDVL